MYLSEYQKVSVDNFMGLYNRESLEDTPPDHASDILNMAFARKREVWTRPGASFSRNLPSGAPIVRMFDAAFDNNTLIPLVCDGAGIIWRLDNVTPLLQINGLIDFAALNMNNHVYIAPMRDPNIAYDPVVDVIYVWTHPNNTIRPAAGLAPPRLTGVGIFSGGNVGPGYYGVAYSYVFDTGYVSPPSPTVSTNFLAPAGSVLQAQGITTVLSGQLPTGVVGFLMYATKAQSTIEDAMRAALYEVETNPDLSNANADLDFFDTDLVILASADPVNGNIPNSMPRLPSANGYGSVALIKYHNRMIIIGPNIVYDPVTAGTTQVQDGRIFVSHPGAPENFDVDTGYLIIQAEFDGNEPRTGFELFGVLYICKAVGTFATQDNGNDPNDPTNPWIVNVMDGGMGAYHHAVGTITGSQPALSSGPAAFMANRNGLFLFNGQIVRPELSWKIRGIWEKMTVGLEYKTRVAIDIFNDIIYVMMATDLPAPYGPNLILACDYSLGLDWQNVRWSIYTFPWAVFDIVTAAWSDPIAPSYYFLRLGSGGTIYRLDGATTADEVWQNGNYDHSVAIHNYYQTAPLVVGNLGSVNIFRFIRYRMAGSGTLFTDTSTQTTFGPKAAINLSPDAYPGNFRDRGIQINYTNEKIIVRFEMNNVNDYIKMSRVDVFGKERWPTRPNA